MNRWHHLSTRVAWVDTDASGRIHFTAAMRWAEAAEHDLLRAAGLHLHGGFPRVEVHANYLAALHFDDPVDVALGIEKIGRTSISYEWQVSCHEQLCVRGGHVAVHVGDTGDPQPLPDELRTVLERMLPER